MKTISLLASASAFALLIGCTPQQEAQVAQDISTVQSAAGQAASLLNTACASASAAETTASANPTVAGNSTAQNIIGYINGSCVKGQATASLVTAALNDPNGIASTVTWAENLATGLQAIFN